MMITTCIGLSSTSSDPPSDTLFRSLCSDSLFKPPVQILCFEPLSTIWQDLGHVRLLVSCWQAEYDRFTLSWLLLLLKTISFCMSDVCHVDERLNVNISFAFFLRRHGRVLLLFRSSIAALKAGDVSVTLEMDKPTGDA